MIGWKPFSIRCPAAALLGSDMASGAITSASPITSTAHSSLRFISYLLLSAPCSSRVACTPSAAALIPVRTTTQLRSCPHSAPRDRGWQRTAQRRGCAHTKEAGNGTEADRDPRRRDGRDDDRQPAPPSLRARRR